MLPESLLAQARAWADADPDQQDRSELLDLVERKALGDLRDRFAGPLAFGTAGLRGLMGAGPSRMNRAVIRRTTWGLARHLLATVPDAAERGVVIGHDARHRSRDFAHEAAAVLAAQGIRPHLFDAALPTPLVPFAVLDRNAVAGVMVTASHNPPAYNGFKVYDARGIQIIAPTDKAVANRIDEAPPAREIPTAACAPSLGAEILERYLAAVLRLPLHPEAPRTLSIAYTPMHGVGGAVAKEALRRAGFRHIVEVAAQAQPDPDFPTAAFPNPEEPHALDLLLETAAAANADIAFANDPDADRLAVAVPDHGRWRVLSGDEVGALLGEYLLAEGDQRPGRLVLTTIVSSSLLGRIARAAGARCAETLTGFKWLGNVALNLESAEGLHTVFAYEEAIGYAIGDQHRDKDGVTALLMAADLAAFCKARGETLLDRLERLWRRHGLVRTRQKSLTHPGSDGIAALAARMAAVRAHPPETFGSLRVQSMRDLKNGDAGLPLSDVLIFALENGARLIARPSGTEPKLKLYAEVTETLAPDEALLAGLARADNRLAELLQAAEEQFGMHWGQA